MRIILIPPSIGRVWWLMPVIIILERQRQEDYHACSSLQGRTLWGQGVSSLLLLKKRRDWPKVKHPLRVVFLRVLF